MEDGTKSTIKTIFHSIIDFFKYTDFEVSVDRDNVRGKVIKGGDGFTVGMGQGDTDSEIQYKGSKVKVSHIKKNAIEEAYDTEDC